MSSQTQVAPLADDEVRVYYTSCSGIADATLLDDYRRLLCRDELERLQRFVFERDRHQFLVAHALLRTSLSRHVDVAPQDWRFATNRFGRPEVETDDGSVPVRFNLSHSGTLCACAVTATRAVGIDTEEVDATIDLGLADRFFSTTEAAALRSLPDDERIAAFFDYWTLKEAYVKACGLGLSLPLKSFTFHRHASDRAVEISFEGVEDDSAEWQFWRLHLQHGYRGALAVQLSRDLELTLAVEDVTPTG